jgi:predicted RNA-binding Zn ribbon-like protein
VGVTRPSTSAPLLGEPLPVELMNTIWADRLGVHDALATTRDSAAWLNAIAARDDLPPRLGDWLAEVSAIRLARTHRSLRELRDAARCLAARRTSDARTTVPTPLSVTAAVNVLNDLLGAAPTWPVLAWPEYAARPSIETHWTAAPGRSFLAHVARATIALIDEQADSELRACYAPGCVLYFTKNHPRREWCSPGCGNRARQARHYERHHPTR